MLIFWNERHFAIAAHAPCTVFAQLHAFEAGNDTVVFADIDRTFLLRALNTGHSGPCRTAAARATASFTRGSAFATTSARERTDPARPIILGTLATGRKRHGPQSDDNPNADGVGDP